MAGGSKISHKSSGLNLLLCPFSVEYLLSLSLICL